MFLHRPDYGASQVSSTCDAVNRGHTSGTDGIRTFRLHLPCVSFRCSNEYYPADLQVAPTQDLRRRSKGVVVEETEEPAAEEDEELEEEVVPQDEPSQKKRTRRAATK